MVGLNSTEERLILASHPLVCRLSRWAERNGCEEPWDQEDLFDDEVHHLSWSCKGQKGVLQHWKSDKQSTWTDAPPPR